MKSSREDCSFMHQDGISAGKDSVSHENRSGLTSEFIYQGNFIEQSIAQLGLILFHKNEILQKVIEDGLSEDTAPRERLAIYKALNELEVGLTDALRIESQAAAEAHEFLKQGPITSHKVSRLTAFQTSVIIESEA